MDYKNNNKKGGNSPKYSEDRDKRVSPYWCEVTTAHLIFGQIVRDLDTLSKSNPGKIGQIIVREDPIVEEDSNNFVLHCKIRDRIITYDFEIDVDLRIGRAYGRLESKSDSFVSNRNGLRGLLEDLESILRIYDITPYIYDRKKHGSLDHKDVESKCV